jgi:nitroreductase
VDAFLAIASKRDERRYADRPVPDDVVRRILDAGRVAGSSGNKQARRFIVVQSRSAVDALAEAVYEPRNLLGATLVIAVVGRSGFDVGRASQNMMLAAWNDGVASCPNGIRDSDRAAAVLGEAPATVLSMGYPGRPRDAERRSAEEWSTRANRRPLDEVATRV